MKPDQDPCHFIAKGVIAGLLDSLFSLPDAGKSELSKAFNEPLSSSSQEKKVIPQPETPRSDSEPSSPEEDADMFIQTLETDLFLFVSQYCEPNSNGFGRRISFSDANVFAQRILKMAQSPPPGSA